MDGRFVTRVDFAYPDRMLIVEADGYKTHGGRKGWVNDSSKRNRVTGAGWRVIVATDESLRGPLPPLVVDLAPFFGGKVPSDGTETPKKVS